MRRADPLEKTLMLGKAEGKRWRRCRRWDSERASSIADSMDMNLSKLRETVKDRGACSPWGHRESDKLRDWTTTTDISWSLISLHILIFLSWSFLLKQYFSKGISWNFTWCSKKRKHKGSGWGVKEKRGETIFGICWIKWKLFLKGILPRIFNIPKKKKSSVNLHKVRATFVLHDIWYPPSRVIFLI